MEGEKIFGSCKHKFDLPPRSKGDSHRHDCVNSFCPHVHTQIGKLHSQYEQPSCSVNLYEVVNTIDGDVEVLEAPCGNGVWYI
jgi:hypothetical protein